MSAELTKNFLPCDVGSSDAYNQMQLNRITESRYRMLSENTGIVGEELLRVLLVDDHRDISKIMNMLIKIWGHDCRDACNGKAGLAAATEFKPHVFMLDLMMPHMNGIELTKKLRHKGRFKDSLIVVVTGCTESVHLTHCEQAGVDLFLVKPVNPQLLKTLCILEATYLARARQTTAVRATPMQLVLQPMKRKSHYAAQLRHRVAPVALAT